MWFVTCHGRTYRRKIQDEKPIYSTQVSTLIIVVDGKMSACEDVNAMTSLTLPLIWVACKFCDEKLLSWFHQEEKGGMPHVFLLTQTIYKCSFGRNLGSQLPLAIIMKRELKIQLLNLKLPTTSSAVLVTRDCLSWPYLWPPQLYFKNLVWPNMMSLPTHVLSLR